MTGTAPATAAELGEVWDLENLAAAEGLCDWMFAQFSGLAAGSVIEAGTGIGTFSDRLLARDVSELLLVEPEPACMAVLRERFEGQPRVQLAAEVLPDSPAVRERAGSVDFVLCQNVLEHIPDDRVALGAIAAALKPGGRLGLLVPAHPRLYGRLDRGYGHERRYTRAVLRDAVEAAGLRVGELRSFNLLGVPGWWLKNRIGSPGVDRRSLRAYEVLLRAWRPLEERLRPHVGLSLIAIAEKPR